MDFKLFSQALKKFIVGLIIIAALLFIPAGTLDYPNGWLFIGLLFIPMFIVGLILMITDQDLLKKRLNAKENESTQKLVLLLSGLMFISSFILAGLNFRFSWIKLPETIVMIASILFLLGYVMYMEVLRENKYLARTVEVDANQKVIDSGLYGIVRHPMYTSTILLFLTMPLILGSIYSFIICLIYPIIIAIRIGNEEKVLENELDGYVQYKQKVKYRILPFLW
ncbi:MAG: isoprenylcysteine carboxylmethyltransferase family protein [Methanobrevibacter sp.]|uniref:methyltransferase family protein n=1 Tax=Methanobrevibacter sp. TaxID=66852 RepID=UPI0025F3A795|nr:methyltransferase [Methanobrevibacter sp.]MBQ6098469.1 isoprenylcysteine carboxylmethyltransferase family protein [Methanobrevibacter sp.]